MSETLIKLLAFDADDTLWVNEPFYRDAEKALAEMLAKYCPNEHFEQKLYERESHNLKIFGYGAKGFTLSMIETAIELSGGKIGGAEVQRIIDMGKELLRQPVQLLPYVRETIQRLAGEYELMIITKGDLFDQESKIARSGLADYFQYVEIVSEKNAGVYAKILDRHGVRPADFLMVGNSLKSDILPVIELGGLAVYIPYETTWVHEQVDPPGEALHSYFELKSIRQLPQLLDTF